MGRNSPPVCRKSRTPAACSPAADVGRRSAAVVMHNTVGRELVPVRFSSSYPLISTPLSRATNRLKHTRRFLLPSPTRD